MRLGLFDRAVPAGEGASAAIRREEKAGLAYMFWGRLIVLGLIAIWVLATLPISRSELYVAAVAAFALLGAIPFFLSRRSTNGWWITAGFLLLDVALLSYLLIVPAPFLGDHWTPQLNYRLANFLYLGVFLVGMALSYSPALVVSTGVAAMVAWSVGVLWIAGLPDSVITSSRQSLDTGMSGAEIIKGFLDANSVSLTNWYNQLVFLGLVTLVLAIAVWRSRRLVRRQAAAESARANLSRYFSPNIVADLAKGGGALDKASVQPVAVLFADMVGFTTVSEKLSPEALIALLRDFHGRLGNIAFRHNGTVDKYIGDAIMVHFGTPKPAADDPARALDCARDMIAEIRRWNAERAARGEPPVGIGIGLHYGEVVVGNIGDARRLEYTVLGDTVNVASRLERLTRDTGAPLVASEALVDAARACPATSARSFDDLRPDQARTVRGRREPVRVWVMAPATATA
jgi:adenylate cyclase